MKYLGVDWGMKQVGLAGSEGEVAEPLGTLTIHSKQEAISKVSEVIKKMAIETVVIGKPEGNMGKIVETIWQKLPGRVVLADETLSSQKAMKVMIKSGIKKKKRRDDHAFAAVLILQDFLDNLRS